MPTAIERAPIRLVVGLGNPGPQYAPTRHNVGFWFVDDLDGREPFRPDRRSDSELASCSAGGQRVLLQKPQSFMNRSGLPVRQVVDFHKLPVESVLIVHDDLDLEPGVVRLKRGGGHGGHNGLRDLIRHLGANFARLRVGIGHPGHRDAVVGYVLAAPRHEERALIDAALRDARATLDDLAAGEWDRAVRRLHTR